MIDRTNFSVQPCTLSTPEMDFANLIKEKEIFLNGKGLHDGDLDVLTKVLQRSYVLEKLYLHGNRITLVDGKFANALANNRTLRDLDLRSNKIGDEGAKKLASALKVNQTLQEIYLWNNQIGDDGAKHLAGGLMDNKSIQMLDLGVNNIGDAGVQSLAASFVVNKSLRKIWLAGNKIGDKGAKAIANAIKCNRTIAQLDLERNKISGPVQARILEIINDPNRKVPNDKMSPLMQLETFIKNKDEEISEKVKEKSHKSLALKDEQIATLEAALAFKDERVANLEADLKSKDEVIERKDEVMVSKDKQIATFVTELVSKEEQIASLGADFASPAKFIEKVMAKKDGKIASLESSLKYSKIVETVDLNVEADERTNKRPRI